MKKEIQLSIESKSEDQTTRQSMPGQLYIKGDNVYIKYQEIEESMTNVSTTVKVQKNQIKIIRHGDMESEHTFVTNRKKPGYYRTKQGKLTIETFTHSIHQQLEGGMGHISWDYDLFIHDQWTGRFALMLTIQDLTFL